jgi:hypothetical protein
MIAAARAENVFALPRLAFEVFPGSASDRAHVITATDPADAAAQFLEGWHPEVEPGKEIEITVVERISGARTHFAFDLN